MTFTVDPQYPQPNSSVTVEAQSYSTDLNRANFTWLVNGKVFKQGIGINSITVPVGTINMAISSIIKTADIGTVNNTETIRPGNVELLWQSDGYTPPFYKGKAVELYGSTYKVTAIPEISDAGGKKVNPANLVYTWSKNDVVDQDQSGYGKNTYTDTQNGYIQNNSFISVDVSTFSHDGGAHGSVNISPSTADVVLYQNSQLYGIEYERALSSSLNLSGEEITLRAEPYDISTPDMISGKATFDWNLNGTNEAAFRNKSDITLRKAGTSGESDVSVQVQDLNRILQGGQANIAIFQ